MTQQQLHHQSPPHSWLTAHKAGTLEHTTQLIRLESVFSRCLRWSNPPPDSSAGFCFQAVGLVSETYLQLFCCYCSFESLFWPFLLWQEGT